MNEIEETAQADRFDRRKALKRISAASAAAWVAPTVIPGISSAVHAASPSTCCCFPCSTSHGDNSGEIPDGGWGWFTVQGKVASDNNANPFTVAVSGMTYTRGSVGPLSMPNAIVTFSSDTGCPGNPTRSTASFSGGTWTFNYPISALGDDVVLTAFRYQFSAGDVVGSATSVVSGQYCLSDDGAISSIKHFGAYYSNIFEYNAVNISATKQDNCITSADAPNKLGVPTANIDDFVGGALQGGGGSNFTGSGSSNCSGDCDCP